MLLNDVNFQNRPATISLLKQKFKSLLTQIYNKVKLIPWALLTTFALGAMVKVLIKKNYRHQLQFNQAQIMCLRPQIHKRHPVYTHEVAKLILFLEINVLGDIQDKIQPSQLPQNRKVNNLSCEVIEIDLLMQRKMKIR